MRLFLWGQTRGRQAFLELERINLPLASSRRRGPGGLAPDSHPSRCASAVDEYRALPSLTNRTFRVGGRARPMSCACRGAEPNDTSTGWAKPPMRAAPPASGWAPRSSSPIRPAAMAHALHRWRGAAVAGGLRKDPGTARMRSSACSDCTTAALVFHGRMRLFEKMDEYLALAPGPSPLDPLRREGERLAVHPGARAGGRARPCHIDPAPANFIVAGQGPALSCSTGNIRRCASRCGIWPDFPSRASSTRSGRRSAADLFRWRRQSLGRAALHSTRSCCDCWRRPGALCSCRRQRPAGN